MDRTICPQCYGSGRVSHLAHYHIIMGKGQFFHNTKTEYTTCWRCNGIGYLPDEPYNKYTLVEGDK